MAILVWRVNLDTDPGSGIVSEIDVPTTNPAGRTYPVSGSAARWLRETHLTKTCGHATLRRGTGTKGYGYDALTAGHNRRPL